MRKNILLDTDWKFYKGDIRVLPPITRGQTYLQAKSERATMGPASYSYNDGRDESGRTNGVYSEYWETITIPHDYIIEQTPSEENNHSHGYFSYENGWYRKRFRLEETDDGGRISLYFEGIAGHADVFVNGCLLYRSVSSYTPFAVDITDIALFDRDNVLAVYINTSESEGWWYDGAGIYRPVHLMITAPVAVDLWGVFIKPRKQDGIWLTEVETTVFSVAEESTKIEIVSVIEDENGHEIAKTDSKTEIDGKSKKTVTDFINVASPRLWDTDKPYLYTMVTRILRDGVEVDCVRNRFGFRTIRFDAEHGFYLNDRQVKIKGVCCHQDYGLTGIAVPENVQRYRLQLMREMGANGFRTVHYPHPETTMNILDDLGFLVMDETRWFSPSQEAREQLAALIKRDRNHPSVILWSIGNEEPIFTTKRGKKIAQTLSAVVRSLDDSRPVTAAVSLVPHEAPVMDALDVIGVNYNMDLLEKTHAAFPEKPLVFSECCAAQTTRGWYTETNSKRGYTKSYDHSATSFSDPREETWRKVAANEWIMGSYQWAGIEHRGETEWPRLCSQSGAVDLFLQKKDAFYQNQSHWIEEPMVHILPHWNHEGMDGEKISVWAYTNCDCVTLFLNGENLGKKMINGIGHAAWSVPYAKGELTAIGERGGKEVARETVETTGVPVALALRLDNEIPGANGKDIAIFTCYCTDAVGRVVPDASPYISFTTNAFGQIVGTGSDVSDHVPVACQDRKMRAGLCSVAVRVGCTEGDLKLYATAEGLKCAVFTVHLK